MPHEKLERLAKQLNDVLVAVKQIGRIDGHAAEELPQPQRRHLSTYQAALEIIRQRRMRTMFFGERDIFGEPAWDILLDLYVNQTKHVPVSVKSASIASGKPASTGLRWLNILEEDGLICSEDDPKDLRRRFVRLTPEGYASMDRYFDEIAECATPTVIFSPEIGQR